MGVVSVAAGYCSLQALNFVVQHEAVVDARRVAHLISSHIDKRLQDFGLAIATKRTEELWDREKRPETKCYVRVS